MKPQKSAELRADLTGTMQALGVPEDKAAAKAKRTVESIKAFKMAVRFAVGYGIGATVVLVALTIYLKREPNIPTLLFLGLPLFFSVWQAAQGFAKMSGEASAHLKPEQLAELDPFTRALVAIGKSWKGVST